MERALNDMELETSAAAGTMLPPPSLVPEKVIGPLALDAGPMLGALDAAHSSPSGCPAMDSALLAMTFGLTICDIDSALLAMTSGLALYVLYALSDDMWVTILEQPGCDRNDYLHRVANRKTMRAIQPVTNA